MQYLPILPYLLNSLQSVKSDYYLQTEKEILKQKLHHAQTKEQSEDTICLRVKYETKMQDDRISESEALGRSNESKSPSISVTHSNSSEELQKREIELSELNLNLSLKTMINMTLDFLRRSNVGSSKNNVVCFTVYDLVKQIQEFVKNDHYFTLSNGTQYSFSIEGIHPDRIEHVLKNDMIDIVKEEYDTDSTQTTNNNNDATNVVSVPTKANSEMASVLVVKKRVNKYYWIPTEQNYSLQKKQIVRKNQETRMSDGLSVFHNQLDSALAQELSELELLRLSFSDMVREPKMDRKEHLNLTNSTINIPNTHSLLGFRLRGDSTLLKLYKLLKSRQYNMLFRPENSIDVVYKEGTFYWCSPKEMRDQKGSLSIDLLSYYQ
jgi:hypothetical protein